MWLRLGVRACLLSWPELGTRTPTDLRLVLAGVSRPRPFYSHGDLQYLEGATRTIALAQPSALMVQMEPSSPDNACMALVSPGLRRAANRSSTQ
jgi:hypothetical protein